MQDQKDMPAMAQQVAILSESAAELARRGQSDDAAKIYQQIIKIAPYHIGALEFLALHARRKGDYEQSLQLLERQLQVAPQRVSTYMNMGIVHKKRGDQQMAVQVFDKALELQPVFPHALLLKGASLEELGREREALQAYFQSFTQAPSLRQRDQLVQMPPNIQRLVMHADELIVQTTVKLLETALEPIRASGGVETQRAGEFLEIYTGRRPPQYQHALQRPSYMYFPGLKPRSFFERAEFKWCAQLEAYAADIRAELLGILQTPDALKPYVELDVPDAAQWTDLNRSLQWSSFHLYKAGERVEENCRRCPATLKAIEKLPLPRTPGQSPEAFFSILKPGTHIPLHYG
ncbi:MAG: aspartyl/asparaginyl beta-hydroxylase domain-containing protein, partial [Gammaproteobacteria bacterium]